jgi:hypothetical protein
VQCTLKQLSVTTLMVLCGCHADLSTATASTSGGTTAGAGGSSTGGSSTGGSSTGGSSTGGTTGHVDGGLCGASPPQCMPDGGCVDGSRCLFNLTRCPAAIDYEIPSGGGCISSACASPNGCLGNFCACDVECGFAERCFTVDTRFKCEAVAPSCASYRISCPSWCRLYQQPQGCELCFCETCPLGDGGRPP